MSHQENRFSLFFIFYLLFFISCEKENNDYVDFSQNIIGEKRYSKIKNEFIDTLSNWENNNLWGSSIICDYSDSKVDSLFCFNNNLDKVVTCVLQSGCKEDKGDGIHFFYGAKIDNLWYFFKGAYIFLPREMYQSDIHTPLSFEKLHEIALKEVFSGYLMKKEPIVPFWKFWVEQEYEVDESWFDSHFDGPSWGHFMDAHSDLNLSKIRGDSLFDNQTDYLNYMYKRKALDIWN